MTSATRKRQRSWTRRPSTQQYLALTRDHKLDVRASQRTFEGAYYRTALGQLSFALVVLKIFSKDFIPIGTTFTVYGIIVLCLGVYRRSKAIGTVLDPQQDEMFETSGRSVIILSALTFAVYIVLLVLLLRI